MTGLSKNLTGDLIISFAVDDNKSKKYGLMGKEKE